MIVQSANIGLASSYSLSTTRSRTETARAWVGNEPSAAPRQALSAQGGRGTLSISDAGREMARQASLRQARDAIPDLQEAVQPEATAKDEDASLSPEDELKIRVIEDLLTQLFGRKVKLARFKGVNAKEGDPKVTSSSESEGRQGEGPRRVGWGVEISVHEKETREERSDFRAVGEIRTADGKVLNLSMRLSMASSTTRESSFLFQAGDAVRKDPLILNFAGNAAELTNTRFSFDLEGDGSMENIAFATGDSAFLARLVTGDDGKPVLPTDGTALFGSVSGDGFGDLQALDHDGNGWVDEADPAWKELALWSRGEGGQETLQSLGARGVGALYVGAVSTPFELGSGAVAETGIWS
jgi:hypothetical protein